IFIARGALFFLERYELLAQSGPIISGITYVSDKITSPLLFLLAGISAFFGLLCLRAIIKQPQKIWAMPALGIASIFLISVFGQKILVPAVQKIIVNPNEITIEKPYIINNIKMTREAFGIDKMLEKPFDARGTLSKKDIEKNLPTIENIRLWDESPVRDTFGQLQEIRTYYSLANVDSDRYFIGGKYRQVMVSAREIDCAKLPSKIWINERIIYTHGYGLAMSFVNETTREGLPEMIIKDIPPVGPQNLHIAEPGIYYGEFSNDYAVVNTKLQAFDYPSGDKNVYTNYGGEGGILFKNILRKLFFALAFKTPRMFFSRDITPQSKLLFNRNILERAKTIAPFLSYDSNPYPVISEGKIFWIIDGYTQSGKYPYSTPVGNFGVNYLRNPVKVIVDAHSGKTDFYLAQDDEPLANTYAKNFGLLFKPISQMPQGLREHLRYPKKLFAAQAQAYAVYHMSDPRVFYNKEDVWSMPTEMFDNAESPMEPYYSIMRFPEGEKEEYILMLPFCPVGKGNMIAWLAARNDYPHYGELVAYRFPKESLVYGPMQIEARINQDSAVAQQFMLWGQKSTKVIRGNLMVIPVNDSLIYVEPVYLHAELGKIPELRGIVAAYGEKIAMDTTLMRALEKVLSAEPISSVGEKAEPSAKKALELFNLAQEKLKNGDFAGYGKTIKELGQMLERMK
ncbi:MAG: UPF0182 family protein, partial [Elusimicrobia bacterium]|nr:UPF0182 family protein [Elusimicrobiota bacterium]